MGKRKRGNKANANGNQPSTKRSKREHDSLEAHQPTTAGLDLDKSPFPNELTTEDRKREAHVYELLGSHDATERIAAADALVSGLLSSEDSALRRHLEKRLFRGLASSRNASRVGFSLVLTEILGQLFGPKNLSHKTYSGLTFQKVLGILVDKTKPTGNITGQEERDFCFGQLFGLQCFVEANILFGEDDTRWTTILDLLLKLAKKKVWLKSQCTWVIVETLPQMGQDKAAETIRKIVDTGLAKTAEGVGIWLRAASCYPDIELPTKPWSNPLAPKSLTELANVLKENVKEDDGSREAGILQNKQSNWTAQLHFVWDLLLAHFVGGKGSGKKDNVSLFKAFWNTVVDDALFSKSATEGQKFRGFMIFQKYLQGFVSEKAVPLVEELFSRNLLKCLINQAAKEDRYLHRAALKSLKAMEAAVSAEPVLLVPVVKRLLGKGGAYDFDRLTTTKTIATILQSAAAGDAAAALRVLRDPIAKLKGDDSKEVEKLRLSYADYLLNLATATETTVEESGKASSVLGIALEELARCSYSKTDVFSPELSEKSRELFRARLASAFTRLTKRPQDYRYLCDAVASLEPSGLQMSAEVDAARKAAAKTLRKLLKTSKKSGEETDTSLGLASLFAITILQLYNGDSDALSTLEDLGQCSEKLKEDDADASAFLVEILLSLVSGQSPLMRQTAEQVFQAFTGQLSAAALERLTDPLETEENLSGQKALFEGEDDEMVEGDGSEESESENEEEEDDEDEVSEIGSDVEFVNLNGAEPMDEDDEGGDNDGEEDGEDQQDGADARELASLDDALAKVLRSHRLDQDAEASSDNESDMTDSEMMALDEKLTEVFKERVKKSSKKKENRDAKETVVLFKTRILGLLAIYVRTEAHNPLALNLLLPLLRLIRSTPTKNLANRAGEIIYDLFKNLKKARKNNTQESTADPETLKALLQEIHKEAALDSARAFARAASTASLLVASAMVAVDKGNIHAVIETYARTQAELADGTAKTQMFFLTDYLNWFQGQIPHGAKAEA